MRFIHAADLHLGMIPDAQHPWGRERANALFYSAEKIVDLVLQENVDALGSSPTGGASIAPIWLFFCFAKRRKKITFSETSLFRKMYMFSQKNRVNSISRNRKWRF